MRQNILSKIKNEFEGFSKNQKKIADFILNNYDKAAFLTAAKLGKLVNTSESTVVRFATELGYDGYPAMQKALQEMVRGKLTSVQRIKVSQDTFNGQDIISSVMQRDIDSIQKAISKIDRNEFNRFVEKVIHADHIYILGVRSSSFLSGYLNFYLHLLFKNVIYVQNVAGGELYEQLFHITKDDVLISLSFPRYSIALVDAVKFAIDHGADVLAITDSEASPLFRMASTSLLVECDALSFIDSMTAPMSLLNAIILGIGEKLPEETAKTFSDIEQVWSQYSVFGKTDDE